MEARTVYIYALCEPGTRKIRYIGQSGDLKLRLRQHLQVSVSFKTHLGYWLSLLESKGKVPKMICLLKTTGILADAEECRCISEAKASGFKLVNATEGGNTVPMTPESRRARSLRMSGKNHWNFGKKIPIKQRREHSKRMSGQNHPMFGKKHSEESRRNMSEGIKKKFGPLNSFFGKQHSEKTKLKMSKAAKNRAVARVRSELGRYK